MSQTSMQIFSEASKMLAQADTIQKAKELKTLAITAAEWAKRKGMGAEAIQYARSYALEAERKMGEMLIAEAEAGRLATRESNPGTLAGKNTSGVPRRHTRTVTTADLGISRKERAEAQKLFEMPKDVFDEIKTGKKTRTQAKREIKHEAIIKKVSLPSAKYRVIYADPPWKYNDSKSFAGAENLAAASHYPTMLTAEICAMPIADLAEDNAVLFCWATFPMLTDALAVVSAWGFKYKTAFVWNKVRPNFGNYHNANAELLIVATRGSATPDADKRESQVQTVERKGRHSEKPEHFRAMIDRLYTIGKRIELFRRGDVPAGWEVWGNEC